MRVFVDADGCPVTDITVSVCAKLSVPCFLLCDTAHEFYREGARTIVVDQGPDSVDLAIANRVLPGDLVVTQDYGLASICLARRALAIHQDGWLYTEDNIQALLFQRHESRRLRAAGKHLKGSPKRKHGQDQQFRQALSAVLQQMSHG